jgi:hydroxyethylthiazole kinase-like uncharacterized protein yjeF
MEEFSPEELKNLYRPPKDSSGEDNGQVTVIGGSSLFHGAPLLSLKVASRIVDMVFFSSPEPSLGQVANNLKSSLASFIWIPWGEVESYIKKSDAILIGPGFMRYHKKIPNSKFQVPNKLDEVGLETKKVTEKLLKKFPEKRWVIDAGSLQTIKASAIPEGAIITPNQKEFEILFGDMKIGEAAQKYNCTVITKGPVAIVASPGKEVKISNGNAGLTKGGTGDVLAGLAVALAAKNDPFLAACAASYLVKATADQLFKKVGYYFNADDLAAGVPKLLSQA